MEISLKMKILFIATFMFLAFFVHAEEKPALTLSDCGVVVGHEMGLWEFFQTIPSPEQVDRVLKSKLKFVKISLRKLKDGVWVVHHDADITIYPSKNEKEKVLLDQLTWDDVEHLKSNPEANIPIYRLEEYIQRDQGRLCWMFSPKVQPDENLVRLVMKLKIEHRAVLLTGGLSDVGFYSSFPEEYGLHFAGRIGDRAEDLDGYKPYLSRLWAMEIDPTPKAKDMIEATHKLGLKAYLDSMRYSKTYEVFGTSCKEVFSMGADITQTNRPLACIKKMGF